MPAQDTRQRLSGFSANQSCGTIHPDLVYTYPGLPGGVLADKDLSGDLLLRRDMRLSGAILAGLEWCVLFRKALSRASRWTPCIVHYASRELVDVLCTIAHALHIIGIFLVSSLRI